MVRENLTNFSKHNSPRDTTQKSHGVGAESSVFCPNFNDTKSLLEVFQLGRPSELKDH